MLNVLHSVNLQILKVWQFSDWFFSVLLLQNFETTLAIVYANVLALIVENIEIIIRPSDHTDELA